MNITENCKHSRSFQNFRNGSETDSASETEINFKDSVLKFQCDQCLKRFRSQAVLDEHINGVHEKRMDFICEHCNKSYAWRQSLQNHKSKHCPGKYHETGVHEFALQKHCKETHTNDEKFQCEVCHKIFNWRHSLMEHQKKESCKTNSASKLNQYDCEVCQNTFSSIKILYQHVQTVHEKQFTNGYGQKKSHACDLCFERFAEKSSLVKHHLTSCPGKPLKPREEILLENQVMFEHILINLGP